MANGQVSATAVSAFGQIAQSLIAGHFARGMERDRMGAATASADRSNELRVSRNASTGAQANLQRWLQSQRTQRAIKNQEALFAQGQEAIAGLARRRTGADFEGQVASAREAGANAARSAAAGVTGDALPAEQAQALATARQRASMLAQQVQDTDDLSIRSSRAAAGAATAGDLTTLLPGLDRSFTPPPVARQLPSAWQNLIQGLGSLSPAQMQAVAGVVQQGGEAVWNWGRGQYNNRFTNNARWGEEDR